MKLPNVIIVEGIDRVGKTTLVNKLVNEFDYSVFTPLNKIPKNTARDMRIETEKTYAALSLLKLLENDKVIIDRFHVSEFVYGLVERHYANHECLNIDEILSNMNALLVYVKPVDLQRSIREHGENLEEHAKFFDIFYATSKMMKTTCDYTTLDTVIESLKEGTFR